jgi:hypothetical protein
MILHERTV